MKAYWITYRTLDGRHAETESVLATSAAHAAATLRERFGGRIAIECVAVNRNASRPRQALRSAEKY